MRPLLFTTFFVLSAWSLKAQVTIPDLMFAAQLELAVPDAVNGDQLDPAHPSVAALAYLDLQGFGISDFTGLEYFTGLTWLSLRDNPVTFLPTLGPNLVFLDISQTLLTELPVIPDGLEHLNVQLTSITVFEDLPSALTTLDLGSNTIGQLGILPSALENLYLDDCGFTGFPLIQGPTDLRVLHMSYNPIQSAPDLPPTLVEWECSQCGLTQLPVLSPQLQWLSVNDNPLTALQALPSTLIALHVANTALTGLPELPEGLVSLMCWGTTIPCLPNLPMSLTQVALPSTVECVPEAMSPSALDYAQVFGYPTPPVCTNFNSLCALEPYIAGTTYYDMNGNGVADDGGAMVPFVQLLLEPGGIQFGSNNAGQFRAHVQPGSYTVSAVPGPYQSGTTGSLNADLPALFSVVTDSDHGITLTPDVVDARVLVTPLTDVRPGFDAQYRINYQNLGSMPTTGTLTFSFDPAQQFVSSVPVPDDLAPGEASWNVSMDALSVDGIITVFLSLPVSTPLATQLSQSVTIAPTDTDEDPSNNTDLIEQVVVGSYDPNDKLVDPSVLSPQEVAVGTPVRYTVRFQNTGTAEALLVRISDTLDTRLDLSSFRFLCSSHACSWYIENGVLSFIFQDINLPDSTSDEAASHGFASFEITPSSDLVLGESVANIAGIYFDYNEPVITEPAVFTVEETTDVTEMLAPVLRVFPNPVQDVLYLIADEHGGTAKVLVCDATGREVLDVQLAIGRAAINVRDLPAGLYAVRSSEGGFVARFIKH